MKKAKGMLEQISADERLRQEYYAREKARLDAISRIKYEEIKGMEKGISQGKIELIARQLKKKFKTLPKSYEEKLSQATEETVDKIAEDIFDIEDLDKYLS